MSDEVNRDERPRVCGRCVHYEELGDNEATRYGWCSADAYETDPRGDACELFVTWNEAAGGAAWPWRKVSEVGLPEAGEPFMAFVTMGDEVAVMIGTVLREQWKGHQQFRGLRLWDALWGLLPTTMFIEHITHWMPWPELPQEDA